MGRFMLYDGTVRPSDSYLATHELPDLNLDEDWYNDDYNVEDDDEILDMSRTCEKCGRSFTIREAMSEYSDHIDWPYYESEFEGEVCGYCAIEIINKQFPVLE